MNNLIVLAAFWNEIEWIDASLEQLDLLNPKEIIISEGTYDSKYPVHSTDGTKEIVEDFAQKRNHVKIIKPIRANITEAVKGFWKGHRHNKHRLSKLRTILKALRVHSYRRNQALTFNYMINISECWQPGGWFMTYDCDQFYPDKTIDNIINIVNNKSEYGLLTAKENTFICDFKNYTDEYEKRNYNNLPHRIYPDTLIIPTRGLVREFKFGFRYYKEIVTTCDIGFYNHYKFNSESRVKLTYDVGDRKKPDFDKYFFKKYTMRHPLVVEKLRKRGKNGLSSY